MVAPVFAELFGRGGGRRGRFRRWRWQAWATAGEDGEGFAPSPSYSAAPSRSRPPNRGGGVPQIGFFTPNLRTKIIYLNYNFDAFSKKISTLAN